MAVVLVGLLAAIALAIVLVRMSRDHDDDDGPGGPGRRKPRAIPVRVDAPGDRTPGRRDRTRGKDTNHE